MYNQFIKKSSKNKEKRGFLSGIHLKRHTSVFLPISPIPPYKNPSKLCKHLSLNSQCVVLVSPGDASNVFRRERFVTALLPERVRHRSIRKKQPRRPFHNLHHQFARIKKDTGIHFQFTRGTKKRKLRLVPNWLFVTKSKTTLGRGGCFYLTRTHFPRGG